MKKCKVIDMKNCLILIPKDKPVYTRLPSPPSSPVPSGKFATSIRQLSMCISVK